MIAPATSTTSPLTNLYLQFMEDKTEEAENALWAAIIRHLRKTYEYQLTGDNDMLSVAIGKVLANLHQFKPEDGKKMEWWVSVVMRNVHRDMLRSRRPIPIGGSDELDKAWENARSSGGSSGEPRWLMTSYAPTEEQWNKITNPMDRCIVSSLLAGRTLPVSASGCGISEKTARNRLSLLKKTQKKAA